MKMIHKESLNLLIGGVLRDDPVARKDPFGVGIDHENRFSQTVEEDAVRSFRPDSLHSQELRPQSLDVFPSHPV